MQHCHLADLLWRRHWNDHHLGSVRVPGEARLCRRLALGFLRFRGDLHRHWSALFSPHSKRPQGAPARLGGGVRVHCGAHRCAKREAGSGEAGKSGKSGGELEAKAAAPFSLDQGPHLAAHHRPGLREDHPDVGVFAGYIKSTRLHGEGAEDAAGDEWLLYLGGFCLVWIEVKFNSFLTVF